MNRAAWLQDRRMQKFRDVLSRWESKSLSALEAAEILGCSERQFRRYRARYEEEGLEGLIDKRLGCPVMPFGHPQFMVRVPSRLRSDDVGAA